MQRTRKEIREFFLENRIIAHKTLQRSLEKATKKQRRMPLYAQVSVRKEGTTSSGNIIYLSDTGAYLATIAPYTINDQIDLIVNIRHGYSKLTITIPGKVARIDGKSIESISSRIETDMLLGLALVFNMNTDMCNGYEINFTYQ